MRVAIIGICGANAKNHLRAYKALGETVGVVVDSRQEEGRRIAADIGCEFLDDYKKLDSSIVDAASVSLPPSLHAQVVESLVSKGVNVLCEKPLPLSSADGQSLGAAIKACGVKVMVGFCLRFDKRFLAIRELLKQGALGEPVCVRSRYSGAPSCFDGSWRAGRNGGGIMLVNSVHYFDLAPWFVGREVEVVDAYGDSAFHGQEAEDNVHVVLSHEGGCKTVIDAHYWNFKASSVEFEVIGREGRAFLVPGAVMLEDGGGSRRIEVEAGDMYVEEVRHFIESVKGGTPPSPGFADGLRAATLLEKAALSIERKERICVKA